MYRIAQKFLLGLIFVGLNLKMHLDGNIFGHGPYAREAVMNFTGGIFHLHTQKLPTIKYIESSEDPFLSTSIVTFVYHVYFKLPTDNILHYQIVHLLQIRTSLHHLYYVHGVIK